MASLEGAALTHAPAQGAGASRATFVNPLYSGADPWIAWHDGWYHYCQVGRGGQIEIFKSRSLIERGQGVVVWTAPRSGWNSHQVWAPELHRLGDRWYIYYAASAGSNATHRMGVLQSLTDDPQGAYRDMGMLYTGDDIAHLESSRWAIDGTVMELAGRLYLIWSGWEDDQDVQYLYIAPMANPWTVSGNRVRLCDNATHVWERVGERLDQRGLNEGPAILRRNGRVFLIYSASGSWQPTYKLGMLHMEESADPMVPGNWMKHPRPVFESTADVFGVGHCCFVKSPDGREDWIVYHSKRRRTNGWDRQVRAQPFTFGPDGLPQFGSPIPSGQPLSVPSVLEEAASVSSGAAV